MTAFQPYSKLSFHHPIILYMSNNIMVCHHYKVLRCIKEHDKHPIYLGINTQNNQSVVIKAEDVDSKYSVNSFTGSRMFYEGKVLQTVQGGPGIPSMFWCGQDTDFNFLIMERLGQNLEELFVECGEDFSLKTVLMLALETLQIIEYLHFKEIVHRAICPKNFCIGSGKKNGKIFLVDYSAAARYILAKNKQHIREGFRGYNHKNVNFTSHTVNRGYDGSRRDDMISWMYMIILFQTGTLPWKELKTFDEESKKNQILKMKQKTTLQSLCSGLPHGFFQIFSHVQSLTYTSKPDYTYIRSVLEDMLKAEYELFDRVYDWTWKITPEKPYLQVESIAVATIPNEEQFLNQQYELYIKQQEAARKSQLAKPEDTLRNNTDFLNIDSTNMEMNRKNSKECTLF